MDTSARNAAVRPLVTVLSGFLGAGKTTLLNHLLRQAEGRRWAAVVNDVAAINIDATVVSEALVLDSAVDVVALGNGCVCCSSRDELAETIAEIAAKGKFEHILVETTGVAEPRAIAKLFLQKNPFGRALTDFADLSSLVTVIDAGQFLQESRAAQVPQRTAQSGEKRSIFELMVEQVECADLLVINKTDTITDEEAGQIHELLAGLNPRAEQVSTERGQLSCESVIDRKRFDPKETLGSARWIQLLNEIAAQSESGRAADDSALRKSVGRPSAVRADARYTAQYGIRSFVFQARRPFSRERLERLLREGLPGLLRAKGFLWIREQPDEMGFLSVTGGAVHLDFLNYWWAAMIESGKARREQLPPALEKHWEDPSGDRRQELVFIGVGLDEGALRRSLEACLEP